MSNQRILIKRRWEGKMETKDIVHCLKMLDEDMTIADAIKFYEEYDKLKKDGVLNSITMQRIKGCGKEIMVRDGKSQHKSFCGCTYRGFHLCDACDVQGASHD